MKNKNIENIFNNECLKLINSKNKDYASPNDFYANFKMAEQASKEGNKQARMKERQNERDLERVKEKKNLIIFLF